MSKGALHHTRDSDIVAAPSIVCPVLDLTVYRNKAVLPSQNNLIYRGRSNSCAGQFIVFVIKRAMIRAGHVEINPLFRAWKYCFSWKYKIFMIGVYFLSLALIFVPSVLLGQYCAVNQTKKAITKSSFL